MDIDISDVYIRLNKLDVNKGPGVDGIPPLLFKMCSFYFISAALDNLYKSLKSGLFPTSWKTSLVTPISKRRQNKC